MRDLVIDVLCVARTFMPRPTLHSPEAKSPPGAVSLLSVLRWACAHPIELFIRRWNWKSAVFSALFRGLIFFTLNLKAGWRAAVGAMLAEFVWRTATSGGWGAATQMLCSVRPMWQALFGSMFVVPLVAHTLEFIIHYTRGTPVLAKSILVSICFTQISDLFNLYVMSNGAMLVGDGARPFGEDMRRVPALIGGFLLVLPRLAMRKLAGLPPPPGTETIL